MDIGKAFRYVFDDPQWLSKIGIGAVIAFFSFLIIPIPLLVGWSIGITRNVMDGFENPLPAWEDWGKLFSDGLKVMAAQLVYTLPFWLLLCIAAGFALAAGTESSALQALGAVGWVVLICLAIIFLFALFFISPAIIIQYVRTDDFSACFRFSEVTAIARDYFADIIITFLATWVIGLVVGAVAAIPIIGWVLGLAAAPYISAVAGHLYGQIAARVDGKAAKLS
jgi:hypothetical protein